MAPGPLAFETPRAGGRPEHSTSWVERRSRASEGILLALLVVLVAVGAGTELASRPELTAPTFFVASALVGYLLVRWAVASIWITLVVIFVARPSLDYFAVMADSSGFGEPSVVTGILFLVASSLWLIRRWRLSTPLEMSRSSVALVVLSALAMLGALTADLPLVSLQATIRLISSAVMLVVLEQVLRDRPDRLRAMLVAAFASLVIPALVAASQLHGNVPATPLYGPTLDVGRIQSTFVHPNVFAAYLTMLLPLAVALLPHARRSGRTGVVVVGVMTGFLLLFTYARGAWIAAVAGVLVVGWLQDRRVIAVVATACVVLALAVPSVASRLADLGGRDTGGVVGDPDSLTWRVGYWQDLLPLTTESPVTGIGLSMVENRTTARLPPHNVFVQSLVETGVAGLAALLAFGIAVVLDLSRALRSLRPGFQRGVIVGAAGVFAAFLVQCLSENLLNQPVVQWYLIMPVAWATSRLPARLRLVRPEPAAMPSKLN